jgi:DNA-binding MarR family transcriptional regulator
MVEEPNPLTGLIGYHVRLALLELRRSFSQHVGGGSIRPGLASLLQLAATHPGFAQTELAAALGVDKASLVALINDAESEGWVRRRQATADRRRYEIVVTAKGKQVAAKLAQQTLEHEQKFRDRFSKRELENLIDYLQRIYAK